jgi:pyruvate dehydrogenase E2 component (dihydrolipoamide acetyltransferase)
MAIEITVPRLGWEMEEGTFAGWLKRTGDFVKAGEPLFALESDKVTMDVESLDSGMLHLPPGAPGKGSTVRVGQLIGYLLAPGEAPPRQHAAVTPRARRLARDLGIDPRAVRGSGSGGRIREQDIRAAHASAPVPQAPVAPPESGLAVSASRRAVALRMMESRNNVVPVTLTTRADATRLFALRQRGASYTGVFTALAACAITQHPLIASRWDVDRIVPPGSLDIGIAVDTPRGLLVPVIRNVPALTLDEVERQLRDLIVAARSGQATPAQLHGSVFTISNLGQYDIDAFTPVVNYPEAAILGIGAIRPEAVALATGEIVARHQVTLSLTFDHRVIDGAPAARFFQFLKSLVEDPRQCPAIPS